MRRERAKLLGGTYDRKQARPPLCVAKFLVEHVIDGQQRLTTLQLFLAAFRDFCSEQKCADIAGEIGSLLENRGLMENREVDRFKVWPTQSDQPQFTAIMTAGSRVEVNRRFPRVKRKYARSYDPRPRMVECYLFFSAAM